MAGEATTQCCAICKWVQPILKGSENDFWQCGYPKVPAPFFNMMLLQITRNPTAHHLSVGDPNSDFGKLCPTYEKQGAPTGYDEAVAALEAALNRLRNQGAVSDITAECNELTYRQCDAALAVLKGTP